MNFVYTSYLRELILPITCAISAVALYHICNLFQQNRQKLKSYNLRKRCPTCKRVEMIYKDESDEDSDDDYIDQEIDIDWTQTKIDRWLLDENRLDDKIDIDCQCEKRCGCDYNHIQQCTCNSDCECQCRQVV